MICQVIGWVGFFATHLYFTDFVAVVSIWIFLGIALRHFSLSQEVYNGTMEHGSDDPAFSRYKSGVTMGCWGLFIFSASAATYACLLKQKKNNMFVFERRLL